MIVLSFDRLKYFSCKNRKQCMCDCPYKKAGIHLSGKMYRHFECRNRGTSLSRLGTAFVCTVVLPILLISMAINAFVPASTVSAYTITEHIGTDQSSLTSSGENVEYVRSPVKALAHISVRESEKNDVVPPKKVDAIHINAEPIAEEPIIEEPVAEELVVEPVAEELVVEPVIEEPVVEPVIEEPVAEPVAEEPVVAPPVVEEPVVKKPTTFTDSEGRTYKKATFTVTAYTLSYKSCGKMPDDPGYGVTASGKYVKPHYTLSAPRSLSFGTKIRIPAYEKFYGLDNVIMSVQDRGSSITEGKLDIYFENENDAKNWGRRKIEVYIYL